jgi:hypothetical protein
VVIDGRVDPTSHNLWPLEIAIAVPVAIPSSAIGWCVGRLIRDAIGLADRDAPR